MSYNGSEARQHAQAISNAMTRLHHEHLGRGPDSVRTVLGRDSVICFLEDFYTQVERTLLAGGEVEAVRETRHAFQRTMKPEFVQMVESITGRSVRQFLSQVSFNPDISIEVFVLDAVGDGSSPDEAAHEG